MDAWKQWSSWGTTVLTGSFDLRNVWCIHIKSQWYYRSWRVQDCVGTLAMKVRNVCMLRSHTIYHSVARYIVSALTSHCTFLGEFSSIKFSVLCWKTLDSHGAKMWHSLLFETREDKIFFKRYHATKAQVGFPSEILRLSWIVAKWATMTTLWSFKRENQQLLISGFSSRNLLWELGQLFGPQITGNIRKLLEVSISYLTSPE